MTKCTYCNKPAVFDFEEEDPICHDCDLHISAFQMFVDSAGVEDLVSMDWGSQSFTKEP